MNTIEIIKNLKYVIDALEFYEQMQKTNSCNNCGIMKVCKHRPDWGEPVRWNCPHWEKG